MFQTIEEGIGAFKAEIHSWRRQLGIGELDTSSALSDQRGVVLASMAKALGLTPEERERLEREAWSEPLSGAESEVGQSNNNAFRPSVQNALDDCYYGDD